MTCWRRLAEWNKAGVWQWLHEVLLDRLRAAGGGGLLADQSVKRGAQIVRSRSIEGGPAAGIT